MSNSAELMRWTALAGLTHPSLYEGRVWKYFVRYSWNKFAERDESAIVMAYRLAVAGLDYINSLKIQTDVNTQLKERLNEYKQFCEEYHLDIEKIKEVFHSYVEQETSLYTKAKALLDMLSTKDMKIGVQVQDILDNFYESSLE